MRATTANPIESEGRSRSVSPMTTQGTAQSNGAPRVQSPGPRRTVSSEQSTTPKSVLRRRWDGSCSAPTDIPKRADSMSPELDPPLELKIPKIHLNTAVDDDIAPPKTPPPRAVSAPRYSNMRVYLRDVEESSLRFFEIPYSWHPVSWPSHITAVRGS